MTASGFDGVDRRGLMFVLSSPSGAGKTTLSRMLLEREPGLKMSVSATTRPMRPGEVDGRDYYFVDKPAFEKMVEQGELLDISEVALRCVISSAAIWAFRRNAQVRLSFTVPDEALEAYDAALETTCETVGFFRDHATGTWRLEGVRAVVDEFQSDHLVEDGDGLDAVLALDRRIGLNQQVLGLAVDRVQLEMTRKQLFTDACPGRGI